ncbi:MAG TPA: hypothetical protein VJJ21_00275 [Candidatus Nanoarchaeia archaeon]|nr:hypothetical protein [Candidatus Nanoarchaeia archaeon]
MIVPFAAAFISFIVVFAFTPWMIRYLRRINLVVKDQNKKDKPLIPLSGGLAVIAGIFTSIMFYVFIRTFYFHDEGSLLLIFAALTSLLMITFVGFFDDLLIRKDKETSYGLKQWQKPILTLMAAVPLIVVSAGNTNMGIPFYRVVDFGLVYPLLILPLGFVFSANMVNLLAGYNGLETGMGLVYTGMLSIYAYVNGSYVASLIALVTFSALLAFFIYNKYPAKIFPGDSLTYLLGGAIAIIGITGDIERAAIIAGIPFIIEFFLKMRSKFKAQTYGHYENGKVKTDYDKIYSLPHIFTRTGKFTEKQVVYIMMFIELIFCSVIWFI